MNESLEAVLERGDPQTSREIIAGGILTVINLAGMTYGEMLQSAAIEAERGTWASGHISDIFGPAIYSSIILAGSEERSIPKIASATILGMFVLDEYFHIFDPWNTITDPQDALCYAGGIAGSYFLARVAGSDFVENAINGLRRAGRRIFGQKDIYELND